MQPEGSWDQGSSYCAERAFRDSRLRAWSKTTRREQWAKRRFGTKEWSFFKR